MRSVIVLLLACAPCFGATYTHLASSGSSNVGATNNSFATSAVNATGGTFAIATVTAFGISTTGGGVTVTDTGSNTWRHLANHALGNSNVSIWYTYDKSGLAPVLSTGYQVTINCTGCDPIGSVDVFSGNPPLTDPYDTGTEASASNAGFAVTLPTITPSVNNAMVYVGCASQSGGGFSVSPGSFTITGSNSGIGALSYGTAYAIQTTATASSPTMTDAGTSVNAVCVQAAFKPAGASSSVSSFPIIW